MTCHCRFILVLLLASWLALPLADLGADDSPGRELRVWTAKTGHKLEARFVNVEGDSLRLLRRDGKSVRIALEKLADEDRRLAEELAQAEKPFAALDPLPVKVKRWLPAPVSPLPLGEDAGDKEFDAFYGQHTQLQGLPIVASAQVNPQALRVAHRWIQVMTAKRPELLRELVLQDVRVAVIGRQEVTTDVPEYRSLTPADYWNRQTRGISADVDRNVVSVGEENLLLLQEDSYRGEQVLVHEFAHTLHQVAMARHDPTFDERLRAVYQEAMKEGLWRQTHAAKNHREYFAEGVQSWFNVNRQAEQPDGVHGPIDTREELKKYDPALAELLATLFP